VSCSEEQHQENRRTELKVIDFLTSGERKSLRQLKTEEFMDEILAELEAEGQVKVNEGENIEDAIANNVSSKESRRKLEDVVNEAAQLEMKMAETKKAEGAFGKEKQANAMKAQKAAKEANERESMLRANMDNDKKTNPETTTVEDSAEPNHDIITEKAPIKSMDAIKRENGDITSYTGFKVVLMFSRYELPDIHPIFATYEDLVVYTTADGNKLYMVGNYQSSIEATKSMIKDYRDKYPQAYVVGFEDGIRTY
jgi:hypothetical protein